MNTPDEMTDCIARAEHGDPAAARRVAEIAELREDYGAAQWWWRRAAEMGDEDARDYVALILRGL
jgi:TPR repeat protein